jgi:hypothetical protein
MIPDSAATSQADLVSTVLRKKNAFIQFMKSIIRLFELFVKNYFYLRYFDLFVEDISKLGPFRPGLLRLSWDFEKLKKFLDPRPVAGLNGL